MNSTPPQAIVATGFLMKHPGMEFDPNCPYRACLLCGVVFQPPLARKDNPDLVEAIQISELTKNWAQRHAGKHPEREHLALRLSGRTCTPEAAQKLANYGLIPVTDLIMDQEVAQALREAPRIATDDAEGTL